MVQEVWRLGTPRVDVLSGPHEGGDASAGGFGFRVSIGEHVGRCFITRAEALGLHQLTPGWIERALVNIVLRHGTGRGARAADERRWPRAACRRCGGRRARAQPSRAVRFYLYGTYIPAEQLIEVAGLAEELGFAGITIPDHVVYPHETATPYPYAPDPVTKRAPWDDTGEWLDTFVAASAILASTERLQVLTGIFVLPMRDPLLVAKSASTLGALFPGRFILGVGAGWLREEFEILGFDFDTRGPRTDEAIEVIRKLLTGERVSHTGRFFSFPDVTMRPAPSPTVPIYIGGDAPPALRRAGRLGDGILPPLSSQRKSAEQIAVIEAARVAAGRTDPCDYIASAVTARGPDDVLALAELGVSGVHVDPFQLYVRRFGGLSMDERRDAMKRYAAEVMGPVEERCAPPS